MTTAASEEGQRTTNLQGEAPAIDTAYLRSITAGDLQLEKEILDLFLTEVSKIISTFERVHTEQEWRRALHTLKGAARSVGAKTLAERACSFEEKCDQLTNEISKKHSVELLKTEMENIKLFLETV